MLVTLRAVSLLSLAILFSLERVSVIVAGLAAFQPTANEKRLVLAE